MKDLTHKIIGIFGVLVLLFFIFLIFDKNLEILGENASKNMQRLMGILMFISIFCCAFLFTFQKCRCAFWAFVGISIVILAIIILAPEAIPQFVIF